jgi:hypothetical protein
MDVYYNKFMCGLKKSLIHVQEVWDQIIMLF